MIFLKDILFNYEVDISKSMDDNIDEFTKMTLLLRGTEKALGETSEFMILLNSLPNDYVVLRNVVQYTGNEPKLELVISCIKVRELELHANKRNDINLYVKSKTQRKRVRVILINLVTQVLEEKRRLKR